MYLIKTNYQKFISSWLLTSIILVFLMIVIGGLTRLTNSGLSITEWELFRGILPPFTQDAWILYFNLYKEIPQFKLENPTMTLNEFKIIFYWEYFHRLFGRIIGIFYITPLVYFTYKKALSKRLLYLFYFIFLMILLQGAMGWYMVESGLVNTVSVSHYRLSLHLFFAFIIISLLFWAYLNLKSVREKIFFNLKNKTLKILFFLILCQIILGAFVSGLDAGLIYQTWPKMNFHFFPDDLNIYDFNLLIFLNEQSFVQFLHRNLAYIITLFVIIIGVQVYKRKDNFYLKGYYFMFVALIVQIILGVFTLISGLNILLASLHQITSVILVFSVLNLNHKMS